MRLLQWVRARDRNLSALRRAGRAAILMPALFALGDKVIGNPALATFAAFGSFAMLLLVDFTGTRRARLQAQAALGLVGAVFVALGTLVSRWTWPAAGAMALVAFGVLFAGVVSSELAGATTALLLAFILPVSLPGPVSSIPDRLAGWALATAVALLAITLLWPAPTRDPLRRPAIAASRALATRLRTDAAYLLGGPGAPSEIERTTAAEAEDSAIAQLHQTFLATPYRPTGLSTAARMLVRLVDELRWVHTVVVESAPHPPGTPVNPDVCAVKRAVAAVLDCGAELLDGAEASLEPLRAAEADRQRTLTVMERSAADELPVRHDPAADDATITEFLTSLDPGFRARELSFAVSQVAANVERAALATQRTWRQRVLGRPADALSSIQERAAAHVERHSVWLHNSVRGAVGLGLAVLVADLTSAQHSFWVVLGALSVLRSNALSTGQNILRGLLGTVVGFAVGALLLWVVGTDTTVLWLLLPVAILIAGFAPAAISFAAGQAAFTVTLVILYNIIAPAGWHVGLLRVEDIALGCLVSLVVGLLFWPRGAGAALGQALAEAYTDCATYLLSAVRFGMARCDPSVPPPTPPTAEALRAAAASRRLDDTFRAYLAESGTKALPLVEVSGLLTGVVGVRLAGDAVLDLWLADDGTPGGDRLAARTELLGGAQALWVWYGTLAQALLGQQSVPAALAHDRPADARFIQAVRRDLRDAEGQASATAVRMIWTGDHLDAVRRLQRTVIEPARAAVAQHRDVVGWLGVPRRRAGPVAAQPAR